MYTLQRRYVPNITVLDGLQGDDTPYAFMTKLPEGSMMVKPDGTVIGGGPSMLLKVAALAAGGVAGYFVFQAVT